MIPGGKAVKEEPLGDQHGLGDIARFSERLSRYRRLLTASPSEEIASLVNDMEEAVNALGRLERSPQPKAREQAAEYRLLIAELDAEIAALLQVT